MNPPHPNLIERAENSRVLKEYFSGANINFAALSKLKVGDVLKIHNKLRGQKIK